MFEHWVLWLELYEHYKNDRGKGSVGVHGRLATTNMNGNELNHAGGVCSKW